MTEVPKSLSIRPITILGMELIEWKVESCTAHFAVGPDWATLYSIESEEPGKGHATMLMIIAKKYYKKQGKEVGGTIALNEVISHLYEKLGYIEYKEDSP